MSQWRATKAKQLLAALLQIRQSILNPDVFLLFASQIKVCYDKSRALKIGIKS